MQAGGDAAAKALRACLVHSYIVLTYHEYSVVQDKGPGRFFSGLTRNQAASHGLTDAVDQLHEHFARLRVSSRRKEYDELRTDFSLLFPCKDTTVLRPASDRDFRGKIRMARSPHLLRTDSVYDQFMLGQLQSRSLVSTSPRCATHEISSGSPMRSGTSDYP
jgi:hypothetical protein